MLKKFKGFAMRSCRMAVIAAVLGTGVPGIVHSQEAPGTVKTVVDIGMFNVAGNTRVTAINVGETIAYTSGPWTAGQFLSVVYGRTDTITTASHWKAGVRGDRKSSGQLSFYLSGSFERNTFAGISRRFEEAAGLAALLAKAERHELAVEVGASLNQQRNTAGVATEFVAARGAARYRRNFGEKSFFQQTVDVLPNLDQTDDLRLTSESQLVAPLSTRVSLKVTYVVKFDNLPEPGFQKTDRMLTAGVQIVL